MLCKKCSRWKNFHQQYHHNKLDGKGSNTASIMLVAEAPGTTEAIQGEVYVGPTGQAVYQMIDYFNYDVSNFYLTNAVRCWASDNSTPNLAEIKNCRQYLLHEINIIRPKLIIAMGKTAMLSLGIKEKVEVACTKLYNSDYTQIPVYVMYHPSNLLRDNSLKKTIYKQFKQGVENVNKKPHRKLVKEGYKVVQNKHQALQATKFLLNKKVLSVDIETTGLDYYNKDLNLDLTCVGFGYGKGKAIVFPTTRDIFTQSEIDYMLLCIKKTCESKIYKVLHNFKFDAGFLAYKNNIIVNNIYMDTMLAAYQINENVPTNLHSCTELYLPELAGYDDTIITKYKKHPENASGEDLWHYNGGDVDATLRLFYLFKKQLRELNMLWLHKKILIPATYLFMEMEQTGIEFDIERMKSLEKEYRTKIFTLQESINKLPVIKKYKRKTGKDFAYRSPVATREVLLEYYKLPVVNASRKTGIPAVGAKELTVYSQKYKNALATKLLEIRGYEKAISTYLTGMYKNLYDDNIVHTSFNLHLTRTGRTSSGGGGGGKATDTMADYVFIEEKNTKRRTPNLQNIPKKNLDLRNIVKARQNHYFISVDFKQAEVGCAAVIAQDEKLIKAYQDTEHDVHSVIAHDAFNLPYNKITKSIRRDAKAITFGILFGRGALSIAEETGKTEQEALQMINDYFATYSRLNTKMMEIEDQVAKLKYVESPLHRRRRFLYVTKESFRQGRNQPVQSFSSDLLLLASILFNNLIKQHQLTQYIKPLIVVHDEIDVEVHKDYVEQTVQLLQQAFLVDLYKIPVIHNIMGKIHLGIDITISELNGGWGTMQDYADFQSDEMSVSNQK